MKEELLEILTDKPQQQCVIVERLKDEYNIKTTERTLRNALKGLRREYIDGTFDKVIISDKNGTYISDDHGDIKHFTKGMIKHAKSELFTAYNLAKKYGYSKTFEEYTLEELANG